MRLKNIDKVAKALNGCVNKFSDKSASWVFLEDSKFTVCICFDGKGEKFTHITIAEKIYQVVDEKVIGKIQPK